MNEESLKYLQCLEVNPGWKKEVIDLVRDDLTFGLTKEQVQRYAKKDGDIERMRLYSDCLHRGYSEDVIDTLLSDEMDIYRCKVALEFYGQGIPLEKVIGVINNNRNAKEMQVIFKEFMANKGVLEAGSKDMPPYARELVGQIKEIVNQIQYHETFHNDLQELVNKLADAKQSEETIDRLYKDISDREAQISAQQDEIDKGHKKAAQQREQIVELEEGLTKLGETVRGLEAKLQEKDERIKELETKPSDECEEGNRNLYVDSKAGTIPVSVAATDAIPVYYSVPVMKEGKLVGNAQMEPSKRRSNAAYGIMAKLSGFFKPSRDIVKRVIEANLTPAQLVQVRSAMEKGLTESQINRIIDNNITPEKMKEIIDLAVLINRNK